MVSRWGPRHFSRSCFWMLLPGQSPEPLAHLEVLLPLFSSGELRSTPGLQQRRRVLVNAAATLWGSAWGLGCWRILCFPGPRASGPCPDAPCVGACPNVLPTLGSCWSWMETELLAPCVLGGREAGRGQDLLHCPERGG